MFEVNQIVVHQEFGLCIIKDIEYISENGNKYFIIRPLKDLLMKILVPKDYISTVCRKLVNKDECINLLGEYSNINDNYNENNKKRKEENNCLLRTGRILDLLRVIKSLNKLFKDKIAANRPIGIIDSTIYNEAKNKLFQEVGYVFDIHDKEKIKEYVEEQLREKIRD